MLLGRTLSFEVFSNRGITPVCSDPETRIARAGMGKVFGAMICFEITLVVKVNWLDFNPTFLSTPTFARGNGSRERSQ
jgi:hypothetical protein